MLSVSSRSRATGDGRLTTTLFWLRTRRNISRPSSSLVIDCTVNSSASRSVSAASA